MKTHKYVVHPSKLLGEAKGFNEWLTSKLTATLGGMALVYACLIIPLLALPMPDSVKLVVGIVFSNWFQAWALPVLQRSQNKTQAQADAKADADHQTLTYLATIQDDQMAILKELKDWKDTQ